ncbi:hypothetical protein GSI_08403 [Ganoderma sinense ZZ0214-1]|uniref:Uncharacterized protein n=1 Tax=Ganoderma sinense ZZ0214-1 TaxID=1077348 RepID=A0A2G8S6S1_9APHY|nr:hypothetical protein GSI_08403 [Ganoderma sinense ZZ0214-1]
MAYNPADPPYIALSTPYAWYCDGAETPAEDPDAWKRVIVLVAELTPKSICLVVCPVLDCDLAPHPCQPIVQVLFPEDQATLQSSDAENKVVRFHLFKKECASHFSLRFSDPLEFWDCVRLISNVLCEAEGHRSDLVLRMSQAIDSIPSHQPGQAAACLCANQKHVPRDEGMQMDH